MNWRGELYSSCCFPELPVPSVSQCSEQYGAGVEKQLAGVSCQALGGEISLCNPKTDFFLWNLKELKGWVLSLTQMNCQNCTVNGWWNYHLQSSCPSDVEALWNVWKIWNYLSLINSHLWRCQKSSHDSSFEWVSHTYWPAVMHYLLLELRSLNKSLWSLQFPFFIFSCLFLFCFCSLVLLMVLIHLLAFLCKSRDLCATSPQRFVLISLLCRKIQHASLIFILVLRLNCFWCLDMKAIRTSETSFRNGRITWQYPSAFAFSVDRMCLFFLVLLRGHPWSTSSATFS